MALFYATSTKLFMAAGFLLLGLLISGLDITGAQSIGVCYGRIGNNLPSQQEVIDLYKTNGIGRMRIYDPDQSTLQALRGSNIELILDVPRDKLQSLTDPSAAATWIQNNVVAYNPDVKFRYIAVGNEIKPSETEAPFVLPAMQNIQNAISSANLQGQIKVSTAIDMTLIGTAFPPAEGSFSESATQHLGPIINFLANNGAPLLANVYPYFAYIGTPNMDLAYALFTSAGEVVAGYQNLFDAQMDAIYSALEKTGGSNVEIVVSESGWPSEGGNAATAENAGTYYRNLISHVKSGSGTPKRPGRAIEAYLFAMFDENQKDAGIEQHFGLFSPDKQPKYQINFN